MRGLNHAPSWAQTVMWGIKIQWRWADHLVLALDDCRRKLSYLSETQCSWPRCFWVFGLACWRWHILCLLRSVRRKHEINPCLTLLFFANRLILYYRILQEYMRERWDWKGDTQVGFWITLLSTFCASNTVAHSIHPAFLSCSEEIDPDEMNVMDQILEVNNSKWDVNDKGWYKFILCNIFWTKWFCVQGCERPEDCQSETEILPAHIYKAP